MYSILYALSCLSHSSLVAFDTLSALPVVRLNRAQIAHKWPLCLSPAAPFARLRTHTRVFENKCTQQTCAHARPSQSWQHTMVHMHTKYALFESYVCTNRIKPSTSHMSTGNVDNRARNICKHNRIVRESLTECCAQSQRQYTVHARFVHTDCMALHKQCRNLECTNTRCASRGNAISAQHMYAQASPDLTHHTKMRRRLVR